MTVGSFAARRLFGGPGPLDLENVSRTKSNSATARTACSVWALGVVLGAALLWATASTLTAANTATSPPRETAGAPGFLAYELDRLFRSERRLEPVAADVRAEASRILTKGIGRQRIAIRGSCASRSCHVAGATGLPAADAERRVIQVLTEARNSTSQARRTAVILGFAAAAALAAAAAAAWIAAGCRRQSIATTNSPPRSGSDV